MSASIQAIEDIIRPGIQALGFELWACQLVSGKRIILRVFVESAKGITADECQAVSRQISSVLEVENAIHSAYSLEVSSPGMDRLLLTLDHYQRYVGQEIKLVLHQAINNQRTFSGELRRVDEQEVVLCMEGSEVSFKLQQILKANLVPNF